MQKVLDDVWLTLVRWRTWLIGVAGLVAWFLPDIMPLAAELLRSQELRAVLPDEWKAWAGLVALVCAVWSRPRPAATPKHDKRRQDDFTGENL